MRHAKQEPTPALNALDNALVRAEAATKTPASWRTSLAAVLLALAVVVVAAVASYLGAAYAYRRAETHTDARIAVLEQDLSQRRAAAGAANANRDRQIAELKALLCVTLDHLTPRDDQVQVLRGRYQCTGGPYLQPPLPTPQPGLSVSPSR